MTQFKAFLAAKAADVKGWLVFALKHPGTARKALAASLAHLLSMIAAFEFVFPDVATAHAAEFTGVTTLITGITTFLVSNRVVKAADEIEAAENPVT